jgi:cyclopropane fatty-acyl-phospholipid synthase-like methyltransferase
MGAIYNVILALSVFVKLSWASHPENIEGMAIYLSDRLPRELQALMSAKTKQDERILIEDLLKFDQMHYDGENAMIAAIASMKVSDDSKILDIGSGYGGPSRYVSWKTGAFVTALELQPEISVEAAKLTQLVGQTPTAGNGSPLIDRVDHQVGNVINWTTEHKYDGFMSMLAFLHVDNKQELFTAIGNTLRPGAKFYIEDYFNRNNLNSDDMKVLADIVSCGPLPTEAEYIAAMEVAGFTNIQFIDKTKDWAIFVAGRLQIFRDNKESRIAVLGEQTYKALDIFYSSVSKLFSEERLGGVVITGVYLGDYEKINEL